MTAHRVHCPYRSRPTPKIGGGAAHMSHHVHVHVNVPFRPIRPRPCSSCDVIVRDIWHIARSAVLQPAIRWNGNNGCGAGSSSSSSLHAVNESRRRGGNSSASSSRSVVSEEHSESDVGYRAMSHSLTANLGGDRWAYGERSLCNGAIWLYLIADISENVLCFINSRLFQSYWKGKSQVSNRNNAPPSVSWMSLCCERLVASFCFCIGGEARASTESIASNTCSSVG
jgi:hypothetical protein